MKRAVSVLVGVVVVGVVSASYAKPPVAGDGAPSAKPAAKPSALPTVVPPPAPPKTPGKTVVLFTKPTANGAEGAVVNDKGAATLQCVTSTEQGKSYAITIENGRAYCKRLNSNTRTVPLRCPTSSAAQLLTETQIPAVAQSGKSDRCREPNTPVDAAASYLKPDCSTDSSGSGFFLIARAGNDTCEKKMDFFTLQMPGAPADTGVLTGYTKRQTPDAPPIPPDLTPGQIDSKAVKCPPGFTMEQNLNGVVCKKN